MKDQYALASSLGTEAKEIAQETRYADTQYRKKHENAVTMEITQIYQ